MQYLNKYMERNYKLSGHMKHLKKKKLDKILTAAEFKPIWLL